MTRRPKRPVKMINGLLGREPDVDQGTENGWFLSWNPDDDRFYVSRDERTIETVATFARTSQGWPNALYYARTHNP